MAEVINLEVNPMMNRRYSSKAAAVVVAASDVGDQGEEQVLNRFNFMIVEHTKKSGIADETSINEAIEKPKAGYDGIKAMIAARKKKNLELKLLKGDDDEQELNKQKKKEVIRLRKVNKNASTNVDYDDVYDNNDEFIDDVAEQIRSSGYDHDLHDNALDIGERASVRIDLEGVYEEGEGKEHYSLRRMPSNVHTN